MAEPSPTQELYACNGCIEQIPQHKARISCHSCPSYHLCANCFVIKQFTPPHTASHATLILKRSGCVVPSPPGFFKPGPALPLRPTIAINTGPPPPPPRPVVRSQPEIPTANWGALWSVIKGAGSGSSAVKDKRVSVNRTISQDSMMSGASGSEIPPPHPPRPLLPQRTESQRLAPSYPRPDKWGPLFEADSTPNSIFVALMSTIFSKLDPEHTGCLRPEVYAEFLDLQGYELGSNIWKYAFISDGGSQSHDVADLELGLYYADLNISHTLMNRPKEKDPSPSPKTSLDEPSSAVEDRIKESLRFSANMPMLQRQGFIDLGAIEYLREPTRGHRCLVIVVESYGIWSELGEMPRGVLPSVRFEPSEREVVGEKRDVEHEDTLPEEVGDEDGQKQESNSQDGFVSEPLSASALPVLPMRLKGGKAKVNALMKKESFDEETAEIAASAKADAMIKVSEIESRDEDSRPTTSKGKESEDVKEELTEVKGQEKETKDKSTKGEEDSELYKNE